MADHSNYMDVLLQLAQMHPGRRTDAAMSVSVDVYALAALHERLADDVAPLLPRLDPEADFDPDAAGVAWPLGDQMDALLKAAIILGDALNSLVLQAVLQTDEEVSVIWLSSASAKAKGQRDWAATLDQGELLLAHSLRVYRNEVLMHFARPRLGGSELRQADDWRERRLYPLHFGAPPAEVHSEMERLLEKYRHEPLVKQVVEVGPGQHNFYQGSEALFYSIAPLRGSEHNPDRAAVDALAKYGGVPSLTMAQVIEHIERFALTVVNHPLAT
jgi:hypothetical protein